jgi:hypothetical protein
MTKPVTSAVRLDITLRLRPYRSINPATRVHEFEKHASTNSRRGASPKPFS